MGAIIASAEDRDRTFVSEQMDITPGMTTIIASMIRDGQIQRALDRDREVKVLDALGETLKPRCEKLRNVPPRVWKSVFRQVLGIPDDEQFEPEDEPALEIQNLMSMMMFALETTLDAPPSPRPTTRPDSRAP
jgi:hypothetical protein